MKAVIFDLFETLITEWGRLKYTTRLMAEDLSVDYTLFHHEWEALHTNRYLGRISGTRCVIEHILSTLNIYRDPELINDVTNKRDANKDLCFAEIDSEVMSLLKTLKYRGFKLGLISNCKLEEINGLKTCAIYKYLDAVVLSCQVGMIKPDIDIYVHCLDLLNEKPSSALFVGDGGSNELEGALRAGLLPLKAAWFIKKHEAVSDLKSDYPLLYSPPELLSYIE